jgi:transcriptional regulator GlxA family with amidase domain
MKHISIIIPEGEIVHNTVISVIGTYKVFSVVNDYLKKIGKKPIFVIELVGISGKAEIDQGLFTLKPSRTIDLVTTTDLIIIPPAETSLTNIRKNNVYTSWILNHYKRGAEVASLCTGAFLLAGTGLLDGRMCSTHWVAAEKFREYYPQVNLVTDKLITDERGIYTNGGAYSFLNLLLYLVEKYCGRDVAIFCAKVGEIDIERNCQSPFQIFQGQKKHDDTAIKEAQQFIENNVTEKISVERLANDYGLSKRNFERRFKKATANTPVEYIQRVKIEYARKSLESTRMNVNEVMYEIGYSDRKTFRDTFKKYTGLLPLEYRKKYNKDAVSLN